MTTTCLDCMVSTGVGAMAGVVGLPSLDENPRGRGNHPLSKKLSAGEDADTDETFGYIDSGFRALGLHIYSFDVYRAFLESHSGHRLFSWSGYEDDEELPAELRGEDKTQFMKYERPQSEAKYTRGVLVFECPKCRGRFVSDSYDWVKPFEETTLTAEQIEVFRKRVGGPSVDCIFDAQPFDITYELLDDWLGEHKSHNVVMKLEEPADSTNEANSTNGLMDAQDLRRDLEPAGEEQVDWTREAPTLAESFVAACAGRGFELDYSPESLRIVDSIIGGGAEDEDAEPGPLLVLAACYVGEVIIRHLGGSWTLAEPSDSLPSVKLTNGGICNPVGKVIKLYQNGEADSVAFFFTGIKGVLEEHS
jgi:hypothetical protein